MADKELLKRKLLFQQTKNLVSTIDGTEILDYEAQTLFDSDRLRNIGFYNATKTPDSKIDRLTDDENIIDWITDILNFKTDEICYLWVNDFLVRIKISDVRKAVQSLWSNLNPQSKGFVLITADKKTMFDFGGDSRDEYNYLFDRYDLEE